MQNKIRTKLKNSRIGDPLSVASNFLYLKKCIKQIKFRNLNRILKDCHQMSLF